MAQPITSPSVPDVCPSCGQRAAIPVATSDPTGAVVTVMMGRSRSNSPRPHPRLRNHDDAIEDRRGHERSDEVPGVRLPDARALAQRGVRVAGVRDVPCVAQPTQGDLRAPDDATNVSCPPTAISVRALTPLGR